jgi:serine/threonine protein kinase
MGEVYLAEDLNLERKVAVKVLPPEMGRNEQQSSRFLREAKITSSLSHPHIAHVYDVGRQGESLYLVMEYVEGSTLSKRISQGPLPADEAANIALQVADSLDVAHEKGIIHRDIKPGNVMLTGRGQVKVLDFGLAKVNEASRAPGEITYTVTLPGMVMGTVQYMSPEQALGRPVDGRSDIFSLGATLYEMLTGRPPFSGGSVTEILDRVVHGQPEAIARLNYDVPEDFERIIRKCLEKEPGRRYQSARELQVDLKNFLRDSSSLSTTAIAVRPAGRSRWRWITAAAMLAAVTGAGLVWNLRRPVAPARYTLTRITTDPGLATTPALSRDGNLLAYSSDRGIDNLDIYVRNIAGGTTLRLTSNPSDDLDPSFSPDGSHIAFRSTRVGGGIFVVPAFGGTERLLAGGGRSPRFSPDGKQIAFWVGEFWFPTENRVYVMPASGGDPRQVATDLAWATVPLWSPDGKKLMVMGSKKSAPGSIWVVDPSGTAPSRELSPRSRAAGKEAPAGARSRLSFSWDFSGNQLHISRQQGEAMNLFRYPVTEDLSALEGPGEQVSFGTALERFPSVANGRIAFSSQNDNVDLWSVSGDTSAGGPFSQPVRLTQDLAEDEHPAYAWKAGKVFHLISRAGDSEIRRIDLESQSTESLASPKVRKARLITLPDASRLLFVTNPPELQLWSIQPGKPPEQMQVKTKEIQFVVPWSISPSGTHALATLRGPNMRNLGLLELNSGRITKLLESNARQATFSPDGKHFTALFRGGIWIFPFKQSVIDAGREGIEVVKPGRDVDLPRWSPDGKRLYFTCSSDGFLCIWTQRLDAMTLRPIGAPTPALHLHGSRVSLAHVPDIGAVALGVGPKSIIYSAGEATGSIWLASPQAGR